MQTIHPVRRQLRRQLIRDLASASVLGLMSVGLGHAQSAPSTRLKATPRQTEGPYYPLELPKDSDFDLLQNGNANYTKGRAAWVEGTVLDLDGMPLKGGIVEIWQCDEAGHYHHPADGNRADKAFQGFGSTKLDAEGRFRFRTIQPVLYAGRTPHIHAKVKLGARELLTTQLYVEGDPGNAKDWLWRSLPAEARASLTRPYVPVADGLRAEYQLVVAA